MVGEDVDGQVEPLPRAVAAQRRRADDDADEVLGLVAEQQRFAQPLELVVKRERHQRMLLGHLRRVRNAIDRARRGVDEPPYPFRLRRRHHRLETVVVDAFRDPGVEVETGVGGNAGEREDGIDAPEMPLEPGGVANIPRDDLQAVAGGQLAAVIHGVVNRDAVAHVEELGRQQRADVAGAAGDQHVPEAHLKLPWGTGRRQDALTPRRARGRRCCSRR